LDPLRWDGILSGQNRRKKDGAPTVCRFRRTEDGERLGVPVELPAEVSDMHHLAAMVRTAGDVLATTEVIEG